MTCAVPTVPGTIRDRRRTLVAAVTVVLLAALAGCGSSRSPQAFCSVLAKHKDRYLEATGRAQTSMSSGTAGGFLLGSAQMVSALGDLQRMWEELAGVAPDDIRVDVEAVRDANAKQLEVAKEAMKDPVSALSGAVMQSLAVSGSYQRIDGYVRQHCDAS